MPSRSLAALSLAVLLVAAGCPGGGATDASPTAETTASAPATATGESTAEATTRRSCSLDGNATVSKPANLTAETAAVVAETVESRHRSVRVDEHTYFNHHATVSGVEATEDGYRVVLRGELDYDERGGENATVVHVRRLYGVTYRVTDRGAVRRGEAGATGRLVCW